jgi:hypothetical protein
MEMGLDGPNASHRKWHNLLIRKYEHGEKLEGRDFHEVLWRYDVGCDKNMLRGCC